jgi:acyl-homoserine lactone acylase PvdQ
MPQSYNPERGWVGTCNHKTVTEDYPYYYSSHMSPSYRYRRLTQLLDAPGLKSAESHWSFQRDTLNLMAREITPLMIAALKSHEDTRSWPIFSAAGIFRMIPKGRHRPFFKPFTGSSPTSFLPINWAGN